MDKINIVCNFTDFGSSWYGTNNKDFSEKVRETLIRSFGEKVRVDWDNVYETNILNLSGDTFTIMISPMNCPGHFCASPVDIDYKSVILTDVVNYQATKNATLVRIPYGDPGMRLYSEYDDEGLFSSTEYMNQPTCLALEMANMALKILGDYNEEAKNKLLDTIKNILVDFFGYKKLRVEQKLSKILEEKPVSGMILEKLFDEFTELRSR